MPNAELASLCGVKTEVLVQAIKRNIERFPADFMYQLDAEEWQFLRSQFVTSNVGRGGRCYAPFAFTEQGAMMAAMVLVSPRAVEVSVYVVRAFVRLREAAVHKDRGPRSAGGSAGGCQARSAHSNA